MLAFTLAFCLGSATYTPKPLRMKQVLVTTVARMTFGEQIMNEVDKASRTFKISKAAALAIFIVCMIVVVAVYCYCFCCCGNSKEEVQK